MIEFTVALIVIMVLLAGLIQIGQITGAHTLTMIQARREAAQSAMAGIYSRPLDAQYIFEWMDGVDDKRYTRDDRPLATNTINENLAIVALAHPDELASFVPANAVSTLGASPDAMDEFFLVKGHASDSLPTFPVIRSLIYNRSTISIESDAWLVWTEGIY